MNNNKNYEFKDGFKVYHDDSDLDFNTLTGKGENLLVEENGLMREYCIKVDYQSLVLQLIEQFTMYGVKVDKTIIGNGKNGVKFNKILMYLSVPEMNEELGITGKELAKWFTWRMAKLRTMYEKDEIRDLLKADGVYYEQGKELKEKNTSLKARISGLSGFSKKEIIDIIEIRVKIRDEVWTKEVRENKVVSYGLANDVMKRMKEVYKDKFIDVLKEINGYSEWLKDKGFKNSDGLGFVNLINMIKDERDESNDEDRIDGSEKNDDYFNTISELPEMSDMFKESMEEVDMDKWSEEDKEMFTKICKRIDEIIRNVMGE